MKTNFFRCQGLCSCEGNPERAIESIEHTKHPSWNYVARRRGGVCTLSLLHVPDNVRQAGVGRRRDSRGLCPQGARGQVQAGVHRKPRQVGHHGRLSEQGGQGSCRAEEEDTRGKDGTCEVPELREDFEAWRFLGTKGSHGEWNRGSARGYQELVYKFKVKGKSLGDQKKNHLGIF